MERSASLHSSLLTIWELRNFAIGVKFFSLLSSNLLQRKSRCKRDSLWDLRQERLRPIRPSMALFFLTRSLGNQRVPVRVRPMALKISYWLKESSLARTRIPSPNFSLSASWLSLFSGQNLGLAIKVFWITFRKTGVSSILSKTRFFFINSWVTFTHDWKILLGLFLSWR